MKKANLIVVYNKTADKILFCRRRKDPYKGMLNFVGGKLQPGEDGLAAAYRELEEETTVSRQDIRLTHLMDLTYYMSDFFLEVYAGRLNKEVAVSGEENELCWCDTKTDFFDMESFAGEGNIGHIVEQIRIYKEVLK